MYFNEEETIDPDVIEDSPKDNAEGPESEETLDASHVDDAP